MQAVVFSTLTWAYTMQRASGQALCFLPLKATGTRLDRCTHAVQGSERVTCQAREGICIYIYIHIARADLRPVVRRFLYVYVYIYICICIYVYAFQQSCI